MSSGSGAGNPLPGTSTAPLSSTAIALTGHEEEVLSAVAVWSRSTVVSLWVLSPALLVLGDRRLRRLLAPIPGDQPVPPPKRIALVREALPGEALAVTDLASREERFGRLTALGALTVAAITSLRVGGDWAHGMAWLSVLYLVVLWWMAQRLRLQGALGARLLLRIDALREAAPLVLHHQERWDGKTEGAFPGYPDGLAAEAIPLGARIIAVVDAFDAMTTDRPYRPALSTPQARTVLLAERGAQFDPRVVDCFLRVLDELPWEAATEPAVRRG